MFEFFDSAIQFFNDIFLFLDDGIYKFFSEMFAQLVIYLTISGIKFKMFVLQFSWSIAKDVLIQLNLSSLIQQSFSYLDSKILSTISFFRIPECINIIMSGYVTRYILSMVGL